MPSAARACRYVRVTTGTNYAVPKLDSENDWEEVASDLRALQGRVSDQTGLPEVVRFIEREGLLRP
jgi:hypothetical protein